MFFNFILVVMLTLSSNVLFAGRGLLAKVAGVGVIKGKTSPDPLLSVPVDKIEMLRSLLAQQPLDTQRLQRVRALSRQHKKLAASKRDSKQQAAREIENDPDFVPNYGKIVEEVVAAYPLESPQVEKLLLWEITDPQGKQHRIFGTMHHLTLDNFVREARLQLEKIIDTAGTIVYEHYNKDEINLLQTQLHKDGYEQTISATDVLDEQIIVRRMHNSKMMIGFEMIDGFSKTQAMRFLVLMGKSFFTLLLPEFTVYLSSSKKQQDAYAIEMLEDVLAMQNAYLTADISKMKDSFAIRVAHNFFPVSIRNNNLADRITKQCQLNDNCLIVIGHGHMTYETKKQKSVITLLRERGFTVEQVKNDSQKQSQLASP